MKRIIHEIPTCKECPYFNHTGAFTEGGAKPCCDHPDTIKLKGNNCFDRVIPYDEEYNPILNRNIFPTKGIPKWCPLDDY